MRKFMPYALAALVLVCALPMTAADHPQKAVPNDPKSDCKVGDYKVSGNTVSWTIDCPKQSIKGAGEITYTDNSYTGVMNMKVGEQEMKTKYSGKWLGAECTKK
ncbi:MAG TPA: DUF3617 family protein [Thermoanaerobaculia bacterium]|nr:DUF3617 family protein [Thermoanaerobaculia bacterium]